MNSVNEKKQKPPESPAPPAPKTPQDRQLTDRANARQKQDAADWKRMQADLKARGIPDPY